MSCITWFVEQVRDLVVSLGKGRDRYAGARIVSLTDDVTPLFVPEGDDAPGGLIEVGPYLLRYGTYLLRYLIG
jgi:hypothetical protein